MFDLYHLQRGLDSSQQAHTMRAASCLTEGPRVVTPFPGQYATTRMEAVALRGFYRQEAGI
jgi:hypothetical protein